MFRALTKSRNDAITKPGSVAKNEIGTFTVKTFLKIERARLEFFNLKKHRASKYHQQINYIFQSIGKMKKLLGSRNIKFIVGIYPDEFHVNELLLNQIFEKFDLKKEIYDIEIGKTIFRF